MSNVSEFYLRLLLALEKDNLLLLKKINTFNDKDYSKIIESLFEQDKQHFLALYSMFTRGFLEFKSELPVFSVKIFSGIFEVFLGSDTTELVLRFLIKRKKNMISLYQILENYCSQPESSIVFRHMMEEEKKQIFWVENNIDLISLRK